ncbi:MAG: alpha-glucosidase [Candidatus Heimdallarchaeota archaeon]|nr:alpha-glucosidase [Candidatus Heimdallarchaeota archaeon]
MSNTWWKSTTVYQIYPRSYKDSSGDGIGDITGIISKLDYIQNLGIETIWFSPFFTSPQADVGYDVADYYNIAPEYGTMEDVDRLIKEIHSRDMKIVLDMVLNHTSDQHPWFLESKSSKDNPKRDWYIWRDGKKPKGIAPPNNWQSMVTGKGWHYDENTDQWYWAQFLPFQPDLNWRNPEVKKAMFDMMRFWLDKGVDGFRLDIIGAVYEDEQFRDNPRSRHLFPTDDGMLFRSTRMTQNIEDNFQFVRELRELVDSYEDRFMVGETFGTMDDMRRFCGGETADGLHSVFLFKTMETKFSKKGFERLIIEFEQHFPDPLIPTWVYSNHDRFRSILRLGNSIEKAKLLAGVQLTMRGVPYIYYGEEIGMHQVDIPFRDSKDALAHVFGKYPGFIQRILMKLTDGAVNRDGCRTPMQWKDDGGFSDNQHTWLPMGNCMEINVQQQEEDPNSLMNCYRELLEVRNEFDALSKGSIELIETNNKHVLGYIRVFEDQKVKILANFSNTVQNMHVEGTILHSTCNDPVAGQLQSYEVLLLRVK